MKDDLKEFIGPEPSKKFNFEMEGQRNETFHQGTAIQVEF